jgi:hypothetical protein
MHRLDANHHKQGDEGQRDQKNPQSHVFICHGIYVSFTTNPPASPEPASGGRWRAWDTKFTKKKFFVVILFDLFAFVVKIFYFSCFDSFVLSW